MPTCHRRTLATESMRPLFVPTERPTMADVFRLPSSDARMSPAVVHGDMIYLSGQVPDMSSLEESDITLQTSQTLAKVEALPPLLLYQIGMSRQVLTGRVGRRVPLPGGMGTHKWGPGCPN